MTTMRSTPPATDSDLASARVAVLRWRDLPQDHPMPLIARRRMIGQHLMISEVTLDKGFRVPTHQHANEQFAWVMSGALRFGVGIEGDADWREITVRSGEVLHLPPNVPHSAEALEDSVVIDLFSPPSEKTGVDRG
jgi:quercetin dioxygenase-like cupin family protein